MSETTDTPAVPPVPEPSAERSQWRRPLLLGLGCAVAGAAVVGVVWGVSSSGSAPKPFTLRGSLSLTGSHTASGPTYEDCTGYSGYDDVVKGAAVTVYDSAGKTVASGALGTGKPNGGACVFPVSVPAVPGGSKFYQVEIGGRGKLTVSAADAEAGKFAASLG